MKDAIVSHLNAWQVTKNETLEHELVNTIYNQIRTIASSERKKFSTKHDNQQSLQHSTSTIVHEVYLKLTNGSDELLDSERQLIKRLSLICRSVIFDFDRKSNAQKRQLSPADPNEEHYSEHLLLLNDILYRLEKHYPAQFEILILKYFGNLTAEQIMDVSALTRRQVFTHLAFSKAFIEKELTA